MKLIKIQNTGSTATWCGQTILTNEYITLENGQAVKWADNTQVFNDINSGILVVNNGSDVTDDLSPLDGWKWLSDIEFTFSALDGKKLSVHASTKPEIDGSLTYSIWSGAGDNVSTGAIGGGDLLSFDLVIGTPEKHIDVKFDQDLNGRVWIHEGYLKFEGGGSGDYMNSSVIAEPTPLQTSTNLDLIIDSNWVKYAPGGAGTGTHGFADITAIALIPRTYSNDGNWDWDGNNLTPNMSNTGNYKISDTEQVVHRYINRIPCRGTCGTYFSMTSDETAEIIKNYFLRVSAYNISNTNWNASVILELYRERTYNP